VRERYPTCLDADRNARGAARAVCAVSHLRRARHCRGSSRSIAGRGAVRPGDPGVSLASNDRSCTGGQQGFSIPRGTCALAIPDQACGKKDARLFFRFEERWSAGVHSPAHKDYRV
jgi:hypothetical protein